MRGRISDLDRLADVLVWHLCIAVLILHMVGTEACCRLFRSKMSHAQQRGNSLAVITVIGSAALPQRFEILREDHLFGTPSHASRGGGPAAEITRPRAVVSLRNSIVAQLGDIVRQPVAVDISIDQEQAPSARLGTNIFTQFLSEFLEIGRIRIHWALVVDGCLEVDVHTVVLVLVHRVFAPCLGIGDDPLFGDLTIDLELVGHIFRGDTEHDLGAFDLLHEGLVCDLFAAQAVPLAPHRDDVHRIGSATQAALFRCADGRPRAVPAEC